MKKSKAYYSHACNSHCYNSTTEEREQSFMSHFSSYISVIAFLWIIWFVTGARHTWPIYPMMGWGIGLFFHALATYLNPHSRKREPSTKESEFI